jgi:prevent-host-death family protein
MTTGDSMTTLTVTAARSKLYQLIDEAAESHTPIHITGKRANAVLISEEDWAAIQETLYLISIPGMRESIKKGLKTSFDECDEELNW